MHDRRTLLKGLALAAAASAVPLPAFAATDHVPPLRQMRGMWIASVVNINWPSKHGPDAPTSRRPNTSPGWTWPSSAS